MPSLNADQHAFALDVGRLLTWIGQRPTHRVAFGEAWRPPEMAAIYAKRGIGIVNSLPLRDLLGTRRMIPRTRSISAHRSVAASARRNPV